MAVSDFLNFFIRSTSSKNLLFEYHIKFLDSIEIIFPILIRLFLIRVRTTEFNGGYFNFSVS